MTEEFFDEEPELPPAERPLQCSECKKPITIHYTEIENGNYTCTSMCDSCPELQRHLQGTQNKSQQHLIEGLEAGLACGDCGTTLEAVRMGHQLGCSHCYEVFSNAIVTELQARNKLPPLAKVHRKSIPLHIGRAPGEVVEINPSLQLIALTEALNEMLKREDYEQAALIRDQINALSENEGLQEKNEQKPDKPH